MANEIADDDACFYDDYPEVRLSVAQDTIMTLIYIFYVIIALRHIFADKVYTKIQAVLLSYPLLMLINVLGKLWVLNSV